MYYTKPVGSLKALETNSTLRLVKHCVGEDLVKQLLDDSCLHLWKIKGSWNNL